VAAIIETRAQAVAEFRRTINDELVKAEQKVRVFVEKLAADFDRINCRPAMEPVTPSSSSRGPPSQRRQFFRPSNRFSASPNVCKPSRNKAARFHRHASAFETPDS
jgi:hypothetical protein